MPSTTPCCSTNSVQLLSTWGTAGWAPQVCRHPPPLGPLLPTSPWLQTCSLPRARDDRGDWGHPCPGVPSDSIPTGQPVPSLATFRSWGQWSPQQTGATTSPGMGPPIPVPLGPQWDTEIGAVPKHRDPPKSQRGFARRHPGCDTCSTAGDATAWRESPPIPSPWRCRAPSQLPAAAGATP